MLEIALALIVFLFPLAYSPGPGNMVFAANGARFGLRATLPANAGYHIATWVVTAGIGLGFVAALDMAPRLFAVLKIAGALYVLWLAFGLIRAGTLTSAPAPRPASFADGAVLLILNPKAYVIIALTWTVVGDRLARRFRGPASARILNLTFGAILAGVAIWMLLA